ncbi:hypothetical protein GGH94_001282 [Coemansia aciculifera]|uniref:RZ-type domain-containing protein n=1 Tax=Coemansia aciculifera TaxID=417176 RepID=A0A9W8IP33_9FUNG|nr:hypothetical protein GGH94_001282 [Coemansia aciculifera]
MITRAQARNNKGISSVQQAPSTRITKPKAKTKAQSASKTKAKSTSKTPASNMRLFDKLSEKDIIETAARKAAENHMHLNIHKFTPTINQAVRISVNLALEQAIPKIVDQVVKEIEAKQLTSQAGSSTSPANNGVVYRTITACEVQKVKAAVPAVTWRRCPKGHQYAVGECGSPAVHGKCIECKVNLR